MNNLIYLNKDPILMELNSSVDKDSAKRMLAFKFFNGDKELLEKYLSDNTYETVNNSYNTDFIEPKSQLEFSF
tara:strand:+ start:1837 stop:2055 length:219 start_codon:yes stop_codon:yes gene_type:complete